MAASIQVGNAAVPGKTKPSGLAPNPGHAPITNVSTQVFDLSASYLSVVSWTISCPANAIDSVWISYGSAAVYGHGIELPPGSFLYEDVFFGAVNGIISLAGSVDVGFQTL